MNILLQKMLAMADPTQVEGLSRFFKTGKGQYGEGDKFLGIKVPVTREVVKECWRETDLEQLEECIRSEYHEVRLAALLSLVEVFRHATKRPPVRPEAPAYKDLPAMTVAERQTKSTDATGLPQKPAIMAYKDQPAMTAAQVTREACVQFYLAHTDFINNWDLVDLSCYPLLGEWLLDKDRSLLYDLARCGKNIWEQRIGMVSTMTFVRHGQLTDTFNIADILLHHPHDLIQKAVGWLLREAGKKDKAALEAFLQPRYKDMPRTMLRYAIEKFPEDERQRYLAK